MRWLRILLTVLIWAAVAAAAPPEARQLFNGKDLSGWEQVGPGSFTVESGLLRSHGGMGLLWYTGEKFGNCIIRVVYKSSAPDTNSGVFIRIADRPKDEWFAVHHGYEVQILDHGADEWHSTGAIYSLSKASGKAAKASGEFNTMEIRLEGQRTLVTLNGAKVNDFRGDQPVPPRKAWYEPERGPRPDAGYIGVQNHDEKSSVLFKEIGILPLKK